MSFLTDTKRRLILLAVILGVFSIAMLASGISDADETAAPSHVQFNRLVRRTRALPRQATRAVIIHRLGEPNSQELTPAKHKQTLQWRYPGVGRITLRLSGGRLTSQHLERY
ncbi:hypothetical protein [Schleiferilactobacillus shenzhenensis]|uniref:Uncharacterized protein n=1 Tax=Schleiferilactobacillus shenzhenensis LY-73 TaxID=1231336 RepID=U4TJD7_9LACO|nr:hypothetical protein [Schleiferilactobacillus shenzhenensis]ERL64931.1 hypothetical protein L248_0535 [Schleiferilactobacillus shenzhenensis LY-73]